jgi:hypothetical protein
MVVFLYRPSPQIPEPSEQAAKRCFDASVRNIRMQSNQIASRSVDLTWIFTQTLFMGLNTILWSLSYPSIRRQHPVDEVKVHLKTALRAINHTSQRWPGVQSALQLYQNLIQGCLKAYSDDASYVIRSSRIASAEASLSPGALSQSPSSAPTPSLATSQTPQSQREASGESNVSSQSTDSALPDQTDYFEDLRKSDEMDQTGTQTKTAEEVSPFLQSSPEQASSSPGQKCESVLRSELPSTPSDGMPWSDHASLRSMLPAAAPELQHWESILHSDSSQPAFVGDNDVEMDTKPWLGDFGDEYSRYMHQDYNPSQHKMQSLSEQQQLELMAELEQDELPDVSNLLSDAEALYSGNIL